MYGLWPIYGCIRVAVVQERNTGHSGSLVRFSSQFVIQTRGGLSPAAVDGNCWKRYLKKNALRYALKDECDLLYHSSKVLRRVIISFKEYRAMSAHLRDIFNLLTAHSILGIPTFDLDELYCRYIYSGILERDLDFT